MMLEGPLYTGSLHQTNGYAHHWAGPAYIYIMYLQLHKQAKTEGTYDWHVARPQLELLLPNPSLTHSPKIDYFATNYLQMRNLLECYENSRMGPGVDNITKSLLFSARGLILWLSSMSWYSTGEEAGSVPSSLANAGCPFLFNYKKLKRQLQLFCYFQTVFCSSQLEKGQTLQEK